jgi:hypothetical protein
MGDLTSDIFSSLVGADVGAGSPTFNRSQQIGDIAQEYGEGTFAPMAQQTFGQASNQLAPVSSYYDALLSGNQAAMMSAEAPQIQDITGQLNQQKQNIAAFTPQGGGQTSILSQLPFQQESQVTQLLQQAQPQAAQGLMQLAGEQGQLASAEGNLGLGFSNLAENAVATDIDALLGKSQQAQQGQQGAAELAMMAAAA